LSCTSVPRRPAGPPRVASLASVLLVSVLLPGESAAVSTAQQELAAVAHSTPNLDQGAQVFRTCAMCHGSDGGGTRDGQVPRIAGQHASVLRQQLIDYRYDRRWDPRMESIAGRHDLPSAQAIADVTAYVSRLDREPPIGTGDGSLVQQGASSYAQDCRACHGAAAQGDGARAIPRLAGQHYEYLRRQIYDAVDGRRPNFSSAHIRLLAKLDHDDIQALADYLSRLGNGGAQVAPGH
jgi:cytochrome c553